ncbi:hypothetical protein BH10PSE11_BH10PSE11_13420 [soil metagenome]
MTRDHLYAMIWDKPVIHVAKRFGISDVALRKICKKHDIPLPPLGYWAKLQHGKRVIKTPLPELSESVLETVHLAERPVAELPEQVTAARKAAQETELAADARIIVPTERPAKLHPTAAAADRSLKKAKPDQEGFVTLSGSSFVETRVGPKSIERAVLLIDAFIKAIVNRGHHVENDTEGLRLIVVDEVFRVRISENRDRKPHVPTPAELEQQAERERWRAKYPGLYSSTSKAYRTWDYYPSGRFSFELWSGDRTRWSAEKAGHWYDRPTKRVEEYLNDAIVALVSSAVLIKHKRAEAAEQSRIRAEAADRRRQEQEKQERARKRREFLF